jgi:hypothetical protein
MVMKGVISIVLSGTSLYVIMMNFSCGLVAFENSLQLGNKVQIPSTVAAQLPLVRMNKNSMCGQMH